MLCVRFRLFGKCTQCQLSPLHHLAGHGNLRFEVSRIGKAPQDLPIFTHVAYGNLSVALLRFQNIGDDRAANMLFERH